MLAEKPITQDSPHLLELEELYVKAFPSSDRMEFSELISSSSKSSVEFWAFFDEEQLVGLAYFTHLNEFLYLMYLAVSFQIQGKGYGALILQHLENSYPGHCLALDIETVEVSAENYEQRKRREGFYLKNGFVYSEFSIKDKHTGFDILHKKGACTASDIIQAFECMNHPDFSEVLVRRDDKS